MAYGGLPDQGVGTSKSHTSTTVASVASYTKQTYTRCMATTSEEQAKRGSNAVRVILREDTFDTLCEAQGAVTETAKAALVGCDRVTLYRIRAGKINPRASTAMVWADRLGVTVEELWALYSPKRDGMGAAV